MLVQHCTLEQHRLIVPVSITRPIFQDGLFLASHALEHYRALIDTGAQRTVVSQNVITKEKLVRTGHMQFSGIHGPETHTRYLASIGMWAYDIQAGMADVSFDDWPVTLYKIENPIEVVNMNPNTNYELILGWDVLKGFSSGFDHASSQFQLIVKP